MEGNRVDEVLASFIEIEPLDTDQFLKVRETLTRIGIGNRRTEGKPTLWQSCHIFHKRDRYYIVHFKQLFILDGREELTDFNESDRQRTELVAALLEEWNLIRCKCEVSRHNVPLMILPFSQKDKWDLRQKYAIGETYEQSNWI